MPLLRMQQFFARKEIDRINITVLSHKDKTIFNLNYTSSIFMIQTPALVRCSLLIAINKKKRFKKKVHSRFTKISVWNSYCRCLLERIGCYQLHSFLFHNILSLTHKSVRCSFHNNNENVRKIAFKIEFLCIHQFFPLDLFETREIEYTMHV